MTTLPVSARAVDPATLLRELTDIHLLAAEQTDHLLAEFEAAGVGTDATGLADFLVQGGLLTPYQAERALAGEAGKLALGAYLLLEPVGGGSLGTVYRAVGRDDRQRYAVKVLPLRSMWNVIQAKRQVQTFAGLPRHPAVVPFVDIGTAAGSHYLVWPFVEGEAFDHLVRRGGPLPPAHAVRLMAEAADGLAVCHRHGIVHGLLKPGNLRLGPDRKARVLDLGVGAILSENIADEESMLDTISTANTALGMMDCAPPETLADPTARTVAGDMYSFGCALYHLLTGVYPFPDGNAVDKMIAHQTQEPVPVRARNGRVPAALAQVVERLMRKNPADRPAAMGEVRDALLRAVPDNSDSGGELPATEDEVRAARVPVTEATPWRSSAGHTPTGAARDASEDSVNFNIPDLQETSVALPQPPGFGNPPAAGRPPSRPDIPPPIPLAPEPVRQVILQSRTAAPGGAWGEAAPGKRTARPKDAGPETPARSDPSRGAALSAKSRIGAALLNATRKVCFWLPARDVVQVSVFGPPALAPGATARLQVYAHPPVSFDSVRTLSRAFQPDTELLATGFAGRMVARGDELGLHLAVTNAGVAQSLVRSKWVGQTRPWAFEVYVPWESPTGRAPGVLTVGLNNVLAARVLFEVEVLPRSG